MAGGLLDSADPADAKQGIAARFLDDAEAVEVRDGAARLLGSSGRDDARAALVAAPHHVPARLQGCSS